MTLRHYIVPLWTVWLITLAPRARAGDAVLDERQLLQLVRSIDERQRNPGDWKSVVYMEQTEHGKVATAYEATVYRRSQQARFMLLFSAPKASAGQGYLRVEKNLWFYDAKVGRWERRTERERIGGTGARRSDLDESRLADEYDPHDAGEEKLGVRATRVLQLTAKRGVEVAFPVLKLWLDVQSQNVLKRQEFALSGKLLRTTYFPKWKKAFSASSGKELWYAEEIRIYDELEPGKSTLVIVKSVELGALQDNLFTKAWLESKSR
jgi:hypothetical protein